MWNNLKIMQKYYRIILNVLLIMQNIIAIHGMLYKSWRGMMNNATLFKIVLHIILQLNCATQPLSHSQPSPR